jgi:hypothetical protein
MKHFSYKFHEILIQVVDYKFHLEQVCMDVFSCWDLAQLNQEMFNLIS